MQSGVEVLKDCSQLTPSQSEAVLCLVSACYANAEWAYRNQPAANTMVMQKI
jgi:hypothetical protein